MSNSLSNYKELKGEFEGNLARCLEQNETDFLKWLVSRMIDNDLAPKIHLVYNRY